MKYLIFLILTICSLSSYSETPTAKNHNWDELDAQTKKALSYIANDDFVSASSFIEEIEKSKSEISTSNSLWAALYYKLAEEYRTRAFETDFDDVVEKAVTTYENKSLDEERGDIYKAKRLQLLGSAYGYRGMYRTLKDLWASAFLDGRRGCDVLETSLELDPNLTDNRAGIGTYLYWRSAKSGVVKYLLFWGDRKKDGIEKIKSSIDKARIIKQWALGGLTRIYIEEQDWQTAIEYANKIIVDSPNDTGTLRRKAYALEKQGKREEAIKIYEYMLTVFKKNDGIKIRGKELNTANAQIEAIRDILRLNKEVLSEDVKKAHIADVKDKLSKRITASFVDIASMVKDISK